MRRNIFLFIVFLSLFNCFSKDFELRKTPFIKSNIIYKDGTSEKGLLRIASSVFKPRLQKEKGEKSIKLDYNSIDKIITNPETENERVFQYLHHNYSKFKIFVELIYTDVLSIYISSTDADDLFYSDFDRQSIGEMMNQARFEGRSQFSSRLKSSDTLRLPNGKIMTLPIKYSYYNGLSFGVAFGKTPALNYYLLKQGDTQLYRVEKNKRFLKKAKDIFNDCPILINDLEQKKITLKDLPRFIEYYKDICFDNKKSQ